MSLANGHAHHPSLIASVDDVDMEVIYGYEVYTKGILVYAQV